MKPLRLRITAAMLLAGLASALLAGLVVADRLRSLDEDRMASRLLAEGRAAAAVLGERGPGEADVVALAQDLGVRVTLVDRNGIAVIDSSEDAASLSWQGACPEVAEALAGRGGVSVRREGDGPVTLFAAYPLTRGRLAGGAVRLAVEPAGATGGSTPVSIIVLAVALVAGAGAGLAGAALATSITRRIDQVTEAMNSVSAGDLSHKAFVGGNDELQALGSALNDMTAKLKRMLDSASAGRGHLEAVLSTMVSGVVFVDSSGRVSMVNDAAARMFGIRGQPLGRPHVEVLRNYQISAEIDRVLTSRRPSRLEVNVIYPCEMSLEVLLNPLATAPGGSGVVVVLHDVTELKRLEKVRKDFVANISHELKTPVTSVKGFAETLLDGALEDPATAREFVEIIYREASRLDMLVHDLIDLSRLESAPVPIRPAPGDIIVPVRASTQKAALRAQQAGIEVTLRVPGAPVVCPVDPERIEQVMDNLLDNAIKFTPRGGRIGVSVESGDESVVVTVSDTGCGILPEDLPRVFERFYMADKARNKKTGGTGLGLSIVKHILELHGGRVWAESEYGRGSSFHFSIPRFQGRLPDAPAD